MTLAATRVVTLSPHGRPDKGAPCPLAAAYGKPPSPLGRHHLSGTVPTASQSLFVRQAEGEKKKKKKKINAPACRREPKRPRVTLSLNTGQLFRRRPAAGRTRPYTRGPASPSYGPTVAVEPT